MNDASKRRWPLPRQQAILSEDEMVAYALEAPVALLPLMPELLADLEELGSDAQAIVRVLRSLEPAEGTSVVDLGCGKGAVAIGVARALGLEVVGIDLFRPFIEHCEAMAASRGVSGLCRFVHGDILKQAGKLGPFDVAIFASLGDVLGPLDEAIAVVRQYVRPGGHILVSDGFIGDGKSVDFPGFEQYADRDSMIARLTACGDTLAREVIQADAFDPGEGERIAARARAIARRSPQIAADVLRYAEMQLAEYDFLARNFVSATWVLQRAP